MAHEMMVKDNIVMAIAAGNSGPGKKTIGSPGNARYVMTVTGTNKQQTFPFFPSRGPVTTSKGKTFNKPDISTISGDVSATQRLRHMVGKLLPSTGAVEPSEEPADPGCFYAPGGVISSRSKDDEDTQCVLKGNPAYRYMTGTSMATPLAAGVAADIVGYMKTKNHAYKASEVKALMMETATDLHEKPEVQGAGMVNGEKLAAVLEQRVKMGLPVGNVAFSIAHRTSRWDEFQMRAGDRFERTSMGILDKKTGHLIHNDTEFDALSDQLDRDFAAKPIYTRLYRKFQFWWNG
jgi:subtilisin family serine protease